MNWYHMSYINYMWHTLIQPASKLDSHVDKLFGQRGVLTNFIIAIPKFIWKPWIKKFYNTLPLKKDESMLLLFKPMYKFIIQNNAC